jgi:hypothetical protein
MLLVLVGLPFISLAQDTPSPVRDPLDLAARYLNYTPLTGEAAIAPLPDPAVPDMQTNFWISKQGESLPTQITATLAASASAPYFSDVRIWVENGLEYDAEAMQQVAQSLGSLMARLSNRSFIDGDRLDMTGFVFSPDGRSPIDTTDILPVTDIDNDGAVHILFASDLSDERDAFTLPNDRLPVDAVPGAFGNERELIYVNTSLYPGFPLDNPAFANAALLAYLDMLLDINYPSQSLWLRETFLSQTSDFLLNSDNASRLITTYLDSPETPLFDLLSVEQGRAILGGRRLFDTYLRQRFGGELVNRLYIQAGDGIEPVTHQLERFNIIDPVSGGIVTGQEAFADFLMTNITNTLFGDGRFVHNDYPSQEGYFVEPAEIDLAANTTANVQPYGANDFFYAATEEQIVNLSFEGEAAAPLLALPHLEDDADTTDENLFYWSGSGANLNTTMTRAVDLRDVDSATLSFDAWYDLTSNWNYGYVSVSSDGGTTWEAVPIDGVAFQNQRGVAYGQGFTGFSSSDESDVEPIWLPYSAELSPYAGREILLRFEYISQPGWLDSGLAVDNLAIEAIDFTDDGTGDGWTFDGWNAIQNSVPSEWLVQVLTTGTETEAPRVRRLIMADANTGEWLFSLNENQALVISVSLLNGNTTQPATFQIEVNAAG